MLGFFDKFANRICQNQPSGCWVWTGNLDSKGYGKVGSGKRGVYQKAHRMAYGAAFGPFEASRFVCHRCDNPACVNPEHLILADQKWNMADCAKKGRTRNGVLRGEKNPAAKLSADDVREIRARAEHESLTTLAKRFLVSVSQVSLIVHNKRWANLARVSTP